MEKILKSFPVNAWDNIYMEKIEGDGRLCIYICMCVRRGAKRLLGKGAKKSGVEVERSYALSSLVDGGKKTWQEMAWKIFLFFFFFLELYYTYYIWVK